MRDRPMVNCHKLSSPIFWATLASHIIAPNLSANDGFSGLANGGLKLSYTPDVVMRSEVLRISQSNITVSYEFKNISSKDVRGIVAFPITVKCGYWDTPTDYPESFITTVNGLRVGTETELRAFLRTDDNVSWAYEKYAKGAPGSEITAQLKRYGLPLDCRKTPPDSNNYKQLISLGLAFDPSLDPWVVFFETRVQHFWHQIFPADAVTRIQHSYRPSLGAGNSGPYVHEEIQRMLPRYREFYEAHSELRHLLKNYKPTNSYQSVEYILTTANSWGGSIESFELIIPNPKSVVVTSLDGEISLRNGDLVITKRNFAPSSELTVIFFE